MLERKEQTICHQRNKGTTNEKVINDFIICFVATNFITGILKEKQINEQSKTHGSLVMHVAEDPFVNINP